MMLLGALLDWVTAGVGTLWNGACGMGCAVLMRSAYCGVASATR